MRPYAPFVLTDVHYTGDRARAACVVANAWSDALPVEEHVVSVARVAPYEPGAFFARELPCLLAVLPQVRARFRAVAIDGYVHLDAHGTPGLGARLHEALGGNVAVIGVAKTSFRGSTFAVPVLRGTSRTPLFVTALGIEPSDAAAYVQSMHGAHRIPTLVRHVDQLARGRRSPRP